MISQRKIKRTTITILILSLLLVGLKYVGFWIEGFTRIFLLLTALIVGLILFIKLAVVIVPIFKTKNKGLIISFCIGLAAMLIVVFEPIETIMRKQKSPVVLSAYCEHTVTSVSLSLREDKSFEYNAGAFMTTEMYYGGYEINKDTIILNFQNKIPENITSKLVFKNNGLLELGDSTRHRHFFKITSNKLK